MLGQAIVATVLEVLRVLLLFTLLGCIGVVVLTALMLLNFHYEERRVQRLTRQKQIAAELRADELRREEEIRVCGRLPRDRDYCGKTRVGVDRGRSA